MADDFGKRFIDSVLEDLKKVQADVEEIKNFKNKAVGVLLVLNIFWGIVASVITGLLIWLLTKR